MSSESIDLEPLYRTALDGIHRVYVFMRFGVHGVSVGHFDDTALPGRLQLLIVPEPMPAEMLERYLASFPAWVVGNCLRELAETFCSFLDEVYGHGVMVIGPPDAERLQRTFALASLREKVRRLRDELDIEGGFGRHFENFTAARNALAHGAGKVRRRDCTDGDEPVLTWTGG